MAYLYTGSIGKCLQRQFEEIMFQYINVIYFSNISNKYIF